MFGTYNVLDRITIHVNKRIAFCVATCGRTIGQVDGDACP